MNPKRFLGLVNETARDRTIMIGDIEIAKNFTFFDVYQDQKDKVVRAFSIYEDLFIQEAKGKRGTNAEVDLESRKGSRKLQKDKVSADKPWRKNRRK